MRNRPDGTVEVAAEADDRTAKQFLDSLREGPPGALVISVDDVGASEEPLTRPFGIMR